MGKQLIFNYDFRKISDEMKGHIVKLINLR
jgi:hypothetical protein